MLPLGHWSWPSGLPTLTPPPPGPPRGHMVLEGQGQGVLLTGHTSTTPHRSNGKLRHSPAGRISAKNQALTLSPGAHTVSTQAKHLPNKSSLTRVPSFSEAIPTKNQILLLHQKLCKVTHRNAGCHPRTGLNFVPSGLPSTENMAPAGPSAPGHAAHPCRAQERAAQGGT